MISCNTNNYVLKCYLNLFMIVADVMQGRTVLAMRIKVVNGVFNIVKKITCFHSQNLELIPLEYL